MRQSKYKCALRLSDPLLGKQISEQFLHRSVLGTGSEMLILTLFMVTGSTGVKMSGIGVCALGNS